MRIPVYQPNLDGNERAYVLECLDTGWISSRGQFIDRFEKAFEEKIGANSATSVANGTVALHLAMLGLGIGPGDEVIVPTFTYVASVNAMSFVGATPVFVDCLPDSWQMDPQRVAERINPRTKALMIVHLYGHPVDMDPILTLADTHGLLVIEDAAEAFGAFYKGRQVGTFGDVACFSFFGNKTITTGEGGMVTARDRSVMEEMRLLKSQYVSPTKRYWHERVGYNFRMTNIQAAIGLAQLERSESIIDRKRAIAGRYSDRLKNSGFEVHGQIGDVLHSYWMVSALAPFNLNRDTIATALERDGIETRPLFYPVHTMPMHSHWATSNGFYPVSDSISARGLNLPSWPGLSDFQVDEVCDALLRAAETT